MCSRRTWWCHKPLLKGALSAGEGLFYTITVSNIRTTTATNVTLSDALPSGFILLSATSTQGSCGNSVSCALGEIGVRVSVAVTIQGAVLLDFSGNLINAAAVSSPFFDKSIGNNQATVTVDVSSAPADLNVSKIALEGPVLPGSDIEYTIKVANNGPATSTGTFVTDDLPHSVSLISANPTQGSCSGYPKVVCELRPLAPGDSAEVSIKVSIAMSTCGQLVNTVVASSTAPDNILANNAAAAVTQIPSIGAWSMAALAALLSALTLWKITTRRGAPS